ncbi:zf-TFIIB domain-containing protein [Gemmobacter denitrificans]|uniref:Zf-TFIIB domain-containing protein n=1 Tax=Gemmobacter denitrificans TaxID=3123040 RepID=A0ABU8BTF1_9RHOB
MRCPVDNETLVMMDRQGIEIDYCPKCRGIWLDRGELDKIIERSAAVPVVPQPMVAPVQPQMPPPQPQHYMPEPPRGGYRRDHDDDDDDYRRGYKPKKRKSLLGEIFDF